MVMSYFWAAAVIIAACFSVFTHSGGAVTAAIIDGAAGGITLTVSIAGPLCLWSGIGALMEKAGITGPIARFLSPLLGRIFPSFRQDPRFASDLCANVCANLLGLGNAATPMGIRAAGRLRDLRTPELATDELCRLVVMNTASIQLLPSTVAALRRTAGCSSPFDILPCVWASSVLSVAAGLLAAKLLGRVWRE